MPAGRLNRQDRQRIAAGLAQGRTYAQIARQLGRPTSTVSREVARNGGPGVYRADSAQQATRRRTRRKRTPPPDIDLAGRDRDVVLSFQQWVAGQMIQMGFPRMPARVLACLLATDTGSLTATDLVGWLQVSPASVSKAISYLEQLDFVTRMPDAGSRRMRYVIDQDVWYRSWSRIARSYTMWADIARQGVETLGAATPAGERMLQMAQFFEILGRSNDQAVEQWRKIAVAQQRRSAADV
jgi:DNA-binding transcriptional regulator GbsR (MarR family)